MPIIFLHMLAWDGKMKDAPVPEAEEPKSAVEIVEQVLKT